jgi:hypothetical protein
MIRVVQKEQLVFRLEKFQLLLKFTTIRNSLEKTATFNSENREENNVWFSKYFSSKIKVLALVQQKKKVLLQI